MKQIFLASLVAATSLFAAANVATPAPAAAAPAAKTVTVKDTTKAKAEKPVAVVSTDSAQVKSPAKADSSDSAKVAPKPAADTLKTAATDSASAPVDTMKASTPTDTSAKVAVAVPAKDTAKAAPIAVDSLKAMFAASDTTSIAHAAPAPVPEERDVMAAPGTEEVLKKKAAPSQPLFAAGQYVFDVKASFEIQAGKTLWITEDDEDGDNLEEWWGRANLALITQSNDFNGKILMWMYPGDLRGNEIHVREDGVDKYAYRDVFEIHEAWAMQHTKYLNFKLGRWEFTQKNGDFFGDYVDGYYKGFKSGTDGENALQLGLTPAENMSVDVAFISTEPHLNKGDLRLMFHFRGLASIEKLNLDLGYRTNVFDEVYDSDSDVRHTISLQAQVPVVPNVAYLFAEGALMGIDAEDEYTYLDSAGIERTDTKSIDMATPITGGILFTPRDYRIILEAEYMPDRDKSEYAEDNKHIKDVLAAFYIEKPLTDRFTLSFGAHSYGNSWDPAFTGNLIGTIN